MTEPTPTQLIRALLAKFLSWGRQQLRTSRGYAVPDLTRYGYGHGAGTTGMRIGLRPAPDGVALHTVTHCLYRVGQGVCPFTHSTAGPFVAWHVWVGGSYRSCVEQRAVESKKKQQGFVLLDLPWKVRTCPSSNFSSHFARVRSRDDVVA